MGNEKKLIAISDLTDRQLEEVSAKVFKALCGAEDMGDARLARILRARLLKLEDEEQARLADDLEPIAWAW